MHAGFWDINAGETQTSIEKSGNTSRQQTVASWKKVPASHQCTSWHTQEKHILNYHTSLPVLTFSSQARNSWTHQHPLKSALGAAQHSLIYFMVDASQCQLCLLVQNQGPQWTVPSCFLPKTATGSVLHMNRPQYPTGGTWVNSVYLLNTKETNIQDLVKLVSK